MQAQLEILEKLERRLTISVPREQIGKQVDARLKQVAKTAKIDGFRPGKAPINIVAQSYGFRVQEEVLGETVEKAFAEAVTEQKISVAGYPRFEPKEGASADDDFQFVATFEVYPEVTIGDLSAVEVQVPQLTVGDAEVEKTIEILRRQRTRYDRVERAAENNDRVIIDFKGTIDGVAFAGGSAENYAFVLGNGQMLPEFEAGTLGLKEGETATVTVNFPENYHGKEVAGKSAQFEITVKNVAAAVLPEVNDEFAKSLGVAEGDVAKMREEIKANLTREVSQRLKARKKENVLNALLEVTPLDLPKSLVSLEVGRLMERAQEDMKARGMDPAQMPFMPAMFEGQAERRVHLGFVLSELVEKNDLKAKDEQVKAMIEEMAQNYENPEEVVAWYYADKKRLANVESMALEEGVVEFVLAKVKAVETDAVFDELMGQ